MLDSINYFLSYWGPIHKRHQKSLLYLSMMLLQKVCFCYHYDYFAFGVLLFNIVMHINTQLNPYSIESISIAPYLLYSIERRTK